MQAAWKKEFIIMYTKLHAFSSATERSGSDITLLLELGKYKQMKNMIFFFSIKIALKKQHLKSCKGSCDIFQVSQNVAG